jgi:hypothetical protein
MQTTQPMNVIPFKRHAGRSKSPAKPSKQREAILTVEHIPRKNRKPGANYQSGVFNGKLIIEGHNFYSDDANILGIIAFICNVRTVKASTLNSREPISLRARAGFYCNLEVLDAFDERAFLEQFHDALYLCTQSRKQPLHFVDSCEKSRFPLAMTHVPEALRVHTRLERAIYDESGKPMPPQAIARKARHEKMIRQLENAIQGKFPKLPEILDIDISKIVRTSGRNASRSNMDTICYGYEVELAMHRLIAHFGFDRMPRTWGELNGMIEYCKYLWMATGDQFVTHDLISDWQKTGRNIDMKLKPWRVPAFDAYVANNIEKLRTIHIADKTLERLGKEWKEVQIQKKAH